MHIRCKFDGGKVVNRSQSGSWQHRCMGAALLQNLGATWSPQVWSSMTNKMPNHLFAEVVESTQSELSKQRKRKATEEAKARRHQSKYSRVDNSLTVRRAYNHHDCDVTPSEIDDDLSPEHISELKASYYRDKVVVSAEEIT